MDYLCLISKQWKPQLSKHRVAAGLGVESFLGVPFLSLDTHVALQLEEDKCFGAGQSQTTDGVTGSQTANGVSLTATADVAGCTAADHTKATVSSFHLGGALTWSF